MNAMFKHAHVGVHHEHHYISHMMHNKRLWIGLGVAMLITLIAMLIFFATRSQTITVPFRFQYWHTPYGPYY